MLLVKFVDSVVVYQVNFKYFSVMSAEEEIPALPLWRLFNKTINSLTKMNRSKTNLEHLAKIIKMKYFSNSFVFSRDPEMSYQQYQTITDKYKSFTVSLLGRFFYILSNDQPHSVISEVQLFVLNHLSVNQPHVYKQMAQEYGRALHEITNFIKTGNEVLTLNVFVPEQHVNLIDLEPIAIEIKRNNCHSFLSKMLIFIKHILDRDFLTETFDKFTRRNLDDLLFLFRDSPIHLKLQIIDIYMSLPDTKDKIIENTMYGYKSTCEQFIYSVYDEKFKLKPEEMKTVESQIVAFMSKMSTGDAEFDKISRVVIETALAKNKEIIPSKELLQLCANKRITPLLSDDIDEYQLFFTQSLLDYNTVCLSGLFGEFKQEIRKLVAENEGRLGNGTKPGGKWSTFWTELDKRLDNHNCPLDCHVSGLSQFLIKLLTGMWGIKFHFRNTSVEINNLQLIKDEFFIKVLSVFNTHFNLCDNHMDLTDVFEFLSRFGFNGDMFSSLFEILSATFTQAPPTASYRLQPANKKVVGDFARHLVSFERDKSFTFKYLTQFVIFATSGVHTYDLDKVRQVYYNVCKSIMVDKQGDEQIQCQVITSLPFVLCMYNNPDRIVSDLLTPAFTCSSNNMRMALADALPKLICTASSNYSKITRIDCGKDRIDVVLSCNMCNPERREGLKADFRRVELDLDELTPILLKTLMTHVTLNEIQLKTVTLESLPSLARHLKKFHTEGAVRIWSEVCSDRDDQVRMAFVKAAPKILAHADDKCLVVFFASLEKFYKKSLLECDYESQATVLSLVDDLGSIPTLGDHVLHLLQLLVHFIILPMSEHSFVAVSKWYNLAENRGTNPYELYRNFRPELSDLVASLCVISMTLNQNVPDIEMSLSKLMTALELPAVKNYLTMECRYLLAYFITNASKNPAVKLLIEQCATILNMTVSDLLANSYGNVFVQVFLNYDKHQFKLAMIYVETTSGLQGPVLRKRNNWVLLNELLLHFHQKHTKVVMALQLLTKEENKEQDSIHLFLKSRLLGILQNFDFKLMARNSRHKTECVESLAAFLKYLRKEHVTEVRFKVIAMLRTANCDPKLQALVWDSFIKTCDVEALKPQLATIFVSLIPLLPTCQMSINDIFRYLLVEHESTLKDNIIDLFFVNDDLINLDVMNVIRKYVTKNKTGTLKENMVSLMKYLQHETTEVQVGCLQHLKALLKFNREELDRMILGYNGIDNVVVTLIDALMVGCGQSDRSVKLACGEVLGVLGAVEPAHLPRRYAEKSGDFVFFLEDDGFIVAVLSELMKALQAEKNTVNMDRFAVGIQEYLKTYDISLGGDRSDLWKQFNETQQELMLPLLNSRYVIAEPDEVPNGEVIYGSPEGSTCQLWLNNWICALVMALPEKYLTHLKACLPAMKKDQKILMVFLPHVILQSLCQNGDSCFREMAAVLSGWNETIDVNAEVRPCLTVNDTRTTDEDTIRRIQCTKIVFTIFDFLDRWMREWRQTNGLKGVNDINYIAVKQFHGKFSKLSLSKCSYQCCDYPRSLRYLEDHLTTTTDHSQYDFLSEIYARLDEPDGVAGVTALQPNQPSLWQRILLAEVTGQLSDAVSCYETLTRPLTPVYVRGLVQCHLDLDNVSTALNCAADLLDAQAEPLWRLGRYDDLNKLLEKTDLKKSNAWGCQVGRVLLALKNDDRQVFRDVIEEVTLCQVEALAGGTYQNCYAHVTRLHILEELRQTENVIYDVALKGNDDMFVEKTVGDLSKEWELRIKIVQESVKVIEPVLCVRRAALGRAKRVLEPRNVNGLMNVLLGDCWLLSAKIARCAGVYQQAFSYGIKAEEYSPPRLFIEKSELHWTRDEHEQALRTLKHGLAILLPEDSALLPLETRKICAEAKLLVASYNDAISNVHEHINMENYKEALKIHKEWEKSWVFVAQFYDRLLRSKPENDGDTERSEMQIRIINFYCKSLVYGTTYVYQALPRLLSIWFDYGTRMLDVTQVSVMEIRRQVLFKMTNLIECFSQKLPTYVFLTALSQLISRICHPQREVYTEIKLIIIRLLLHYPQHTLWMLISVIRSSYPMRAKRCAEILTDDRLKDASMLKLIRDFTNVAEKLTEMCNKDLPGNADTITVSSVMRMLPRLLSKDDLSEIMIPTHKFRKLVLPNPDFSSIQHDPFPNRYVYIKGIEEEMTILHSLQKPRKITFRGSDGKKYCQMLKPKDDLRRDFRLMEFNDIVNQLFLKEPKARQRRLNIRLYSVAPLNEECGLIEWVEDLVGLRPAISNIYKQMGIGLKGKELKETSCGIRDPLSKKMNVFLKVLLPKHPPVLGEWFRSTFPDAQSWMLARQSFVRTTAVMSMVGYILGLGDRHGENISLDSTNGDTVHVDFNCLFNRGETFEWPERVPFRLTQNMVAAMGPLGVEGPFRKSCACSLKVLRDNAETLMSVVTPFVYDPLVSWTKCGITKNMAAERTNDQALEHVKNIELRLQGIVKTKARENSIPLSVDGQTDFLINEAISLENLCQMYIGWGAYL